MTDRKKNAGFQGLKKIIFAAVLVFSLAAAPDTAFGGEHLTLRVALLGPGSELYFWWGHLSLLIEDSVTGQDIFFDWGLFSFDTENFFTNFAMGRLLFTTGSFDAVNYKAAYMWQNRDIILFTLDLPPETRQRVWEFAVYSVQPENRDYWYHHFFDNCATRIRDVLDMATGGQFWDQLGEAPSRFTFRQHVRRHTWFSPAADWLLNFLMGQRIDEPITVWNDMFLPSEVAKQIAAFYYTDSYGVSRPLVSDIEVFFQSQGRPPVLDYPPSPWPGRLFFSLVVAAFIFVFSFLQKRGRRFGQVMLGLSHSAAGFVFGSAGLLLYFMAIFTDHDYTFDNINMLFGTPLLLAAVPLGIRYARLKNKAKGPCDQFLKTSFYLRCLWLLCAAGVSASMLIKILPQFWQDNLAEQMLMLPMALAFVLQPALLKEVREKYLKRKARMVEKGHF